MFLLYILKNVLGFRRDTVVIHEYIKEGQMKNSNIPHHVIGKTQVLLIMG